MPELSVQGFPSRRCPADRIDLMYGETSAIFEVLVTHGPGLPPNLDDALDGRKVLGRNCRTIIAALRANPAPGIGRALEFITDALREAEETANHAASFSVLGLSDA